MFKNKKKFGEIAVAQGLASPADIEDALRLQKEFLKQDSFHKKIGMILFEKGVIAEKDIEFILAEQKRQTSLLAWFYAFFNLNK